jgi:hypothetical protein
VAVLRGFTWKRWKLASFVEGLKKALKPPDAKDTTLSVVSVNANAPLTTYRYGMANPFGSEHVSPAKLISINLPVPLNVTIPLEGVQ